jgi:hypothetical protein
MTDETKKQTRLREIPYFESQRQRVLGLSDIANSLTGKVEYVGQDLTFGHWVREAIVVAPGNKVYLAKNFPREWVRPMCVSDLNHTYPLTPFFNLDDIALKTELVQLGRLEKNPEDFGDILPEDDLKRVLTNYLKSEGVPEAVSYGLNGLTRFVDNIEQGSDGLRVRPIVAQVANGKLNLSTYCLLCGKDIFCLQKINCFKKNS